MSGSPEVEEIPLRSGVIRRSNLKGPTRVFRLCVLGILLPSLLLGIPLYLRYRVYGNQLYPLAMSDMRMLDNRVSTTWCQRQRIKTNATFNAFLLATAPKLANQLNTLSMVRHLILEDDFKEYWGFYLLKGSSVTVNTWPGASLIVIRGHKHLHECAYIGDDSSEEMDELMEAVREGTYVGDGQDLEGLGVSNESVANDPDLMKRHRADVKFHSPLHELNKENYTLPNNVDTSDLTDSKLMKTILEAIRLKQKKKKGTKAEEVHPHFKRNSTIAEMETENINIQAPTDPVGVPATSQEIFKDIFERLRNLGEKGAQILEKLNQQFVGVNKTHEHSFGTRGRHYHKPVVQYNENIDDEKRRRRRAVETAYHDLNEDDGVNDRGIEEGFTPRPDGIAEHRGVINETTDNDMSNSEFWSSFSSSEEALLNCAGLILNLPLTPHHNCRRELSETQAEETYLANSITYRVPVNGYYFFVFNSENEVQPNYIRVQFHLNKAVYDVSNPIASCRNSSDVCEVDLNFFSSEKLVLELPVKENETLWNEEYIVESECEPRTALYAICVVTVPVLVVLFAFS
ncbi:uncharacterized protein LOC132701659 isoform X2 [Cylas formicarius]|uniref:uncharacterized protein LOC132701659 isoform X2 n=1 Tax=Cylas formicarius TaxID=197179 RepID=UPI002958D068|nr:uncharacterized protein LOC132701659 isoform X2 [Cylas formicarius]